MTLIHAITALFPLLLPIWQQQPLAPSDFDQAPAPIVARSADIQFALDGMEYVDPQLREDIIRQLGTVDGNNGVVALTGLLNRLNSSQQLAAVLTMLDRFERLPKASARAVFNCLYHPNAHVRQAACRAIAAIPASPQIAARLLDMAKADDDERVRSMALNALQPNHATAVRREHMIPFLNSSEQSLRVNAWQIFLTREARTPTVPAVVLAIGLDDPSQHVRYVLAENMQPRHGNEAWLALERLSAAAESAVRARSAASMANFSTTAANQRLLELLEDPDAEVRHQATRSLRNFANSATATTLVEHLDDSSVFVRQAQQNTLVELNAQVAVAELVATALAGESADARESACHVLGRIDAQRFASDIARLMEREERPANVAAAVQAIGRLRWSPARTAVAELASHADATVREAVAQTLGRIGNESTRETLDELIHDQESVVRVAAITAAGHLEDSYFLNVFGEILDAVKSRSNTTNFSAQDRMAALWSAARVQPMPVSFAQRIRNHITRPVVPTMMGPVFDTESVLISGLFALAQGARGNYETRPMFIAAYELFAREPDESASSNSPNALVPSPSLREYARQSLALYEFGDENRLQPTPLPSQQARFPYRPISR